MVDAPGAIPPFFPKGAGTTLAKTGYWQYGHRVTRLCKADGGTLWILQ